MITKSSTSNINNFQKSNSLKGITAGISALKDSDISGTTGSPTTATFTEGGVNYKAYIFKSTGSITFSDAGLCDVLVVASGAGAVGGDAPVAKAGGGAGGTMYYPNYNTTSGAKTVTIGAGGGAGGGRGNTSLFDLIVQTGGGAGSSGAGASGAGGDGNVNGGYDGGGSYNLTFGGNVGGAGSTQPRAGGGGGGGAVGATGLASGNGGIGSIITIIPTTTATSASVGQVSGSNVYYGGGGGGSHASSGQASGTGGLGGGGNGGTRYGAAPTNGTANTGGGGGGSSNASSASGGSGLVIIRVLA